MAEDQGAVAVVKKKRKAWWIVGSVATAFTLFAAIASYLDFNNPDAEIERAVAQIVEEYGFELEDQGMRLITSWPRPIFDSYKRAPMDAETADEIVAILLEACPTWEHSSTVPNAYRQPNAMNSDPPWMDTHNFIAPEQSASSTTRIYFARDNSGLDPDGYERKATLYLFKYERPSLWQRIKGMWPW